MKESIFVKQNLDSWRESESLISKKNDLPPKLSRVFIKSTDDLSYAYTYYKNRSVRVYLNGVAKILYSRVNQSERFRFSNIKNFFLVSVPLAIYEARKEFLFTLVLFIISMLIGIVSSKHDSEFAQLILGDSYVGMTEENIAKNDPMAVYKSSAPFDMFLAISVNNALVALRTFVFGLFMAVGTIVIMIYNGIMVGAFQYFFIEQGLFKESFLTIWQHGIFEISSIIMAGASGIVLGKGLLFPGNYTRLQSLRISARRGLKLFLGIIPILLTAAFIEGFYTRFTEIPDIVRLFTILLSSGFIIIYFFFLPLKRRREYPGYSSSIESLNGTSEEEPSFDKVYTAAESFMLTFNVLKRKIKPLLVLTFLFSLIYPLYVLTEGLLHPVDEDIYLYNMNEQRLLLGNPFGIMVLYLQISLVSYKLFRMKVLQNVQNQGLDIDFKHLAPRILGLQALVHLPLFVDSNYIVIVYAVLMIFATLVLSIMSQEGTGTLGAFKKSFTYLKGNSGKFLALAIRYLVLAFLIYYVINVLVLRINMEFFKMNMQEDMKYIQLIMRSIYAYYTSFILVFIYSVFYMGNKVLYHSLHESIYAKGLKSRISNIGNTRRIRGLIRE